MLRSKLRSLQNISNFNPDLFTTKSSKDAVNILRKYGVVVVRNVFAEEELFLKIDKQVINNLIKSPFKYSDNYELLKGAHKRGKKKSYIKSKSKFEYIDKGIIDVHNIDIKDLLGSSFFSIKEKCANIVNNSFPKKFRKESYFNLYYYNNVYEPRAFHRDSQINRIKCFIPLTPCQNIENGPYAIFPGSYNRRILNLIEFLTNKLIGSDIGDGDLDATLTSYKKLIPIFYNQGDLIITRQDNIHGDFPCKEDFSRASLVLNMFQ